MKFICTASKVSWFTVGREYDCGNGRLLLIEDDDGDPWYMEKYGDGFRPEHLDDAEFSVAPEPVTAADDVPPSEQVQHEALLAAVVQMADEEGIRDSFDRHLASIRHRFGLLKNPQSQRAFLLALAYFAEEKSQ